MDESILTTDMENYACHCKECRATMKEWQTCVRTASSATNMVCEPARLCKCLQIFEHGNFNRPQQSIKKLAWPAGSFSMSRKTQHDLARRAMLSGASADQLLFFLLSQCSKQGVFSSRAQRQRRTQVCATASRQQDSVCLRFCPSRQGWGGGQGGGGGAHEESSFLPASTTCSVVMP